MNVPQRSGKCTFTKTWRQLINMVRLGAHSIVLCVTVTLCEPDCACLCACVLHKPSWGYEAKAQIECVTVVMLCVNHRLMVVEYICSFLFFVAFHHAEHLEGFFVPSHLWAHIASTGEVWHHCPLKYALYIFGYPSRQFLMVCFTAF